ncbi:MAG: error-prone DNA polymerase [Acidobacteria bacterium]|nr:error-prone DNA polymerase [Acidobacteriota bacterium]
MGSRRLGHRVEQRRAVPDLFEAPGGGVVCGGRLRLKYVELHTRSAFSFLEGASLPEELATICAKLDGPAMALADVDNVAGAPRFYLAARKLGVRAHLGAEITIGTGARLTVLAENRTGYQNLCRLITAMKLRAPKGEARASEEELRQFSQGLVCLTGGAEGPLADALARGAGPDCIAQLTDIYGSGNVYAELQRHLSREEEARNQAVVALSESHGLPLLATNGVRHATRADRELFDVLTCVHHHTTIAEAGRLLALNGERHLKSADEMIRLFSDYPSAIANTVELSSRLDFTLADLGYRFPPYPVAPGETMDSFLRQRTDEGARRRYRPYHDRARNQIERELTLIEKLGLAGYFLIVWDIVEFCRRKGILVQGRGSAANSAVCYSLGITAVDPVGMELLFERFLSEERGEWPDIDLDLPSGDDRESAIQYVYQRYGSRGAAMTANVITYRGRSAARDVGKVLGFSEYELAKLASVVPHWGWKDPNANAETVFREAGFDTDRKPIQKFLELFSAIQDLPRHLGQHSGGLVICQGHLDEVVPIEPATMPGRYVIQWDKEDCADLGLIKVDLLGLGMMAVLKDSIRIIGDVYKEEVDLAQLPANDAKVYDALQRADTVGMFQVESRAQMSCLPRMKPDHFYDIVVQVAIIRPGPIVGKMLNPYLKRRQGLEPVECLHPSLEPVLRRTLGVPLFQEQLLKIAMIAAGFSGGQAEELRRAFGFKRSEARMRDIEVKLRAGMNAQGISGVVQDTIIQAITSFALYGFPESHAASFALIAYASAYLKCHYLAAFTAALLNNQPMGFYHPATLVKDAQRHGLRVLPVDITVSGWECSVTPDLELRLGLNYVRGLRKAAADAIVAARPFAHISDLARRVPELSKDELRSLAEIGAMNLIEKGRKSHRRDALWHAEAAMRPAGPLLENANAAGAEEAPLAPMSLEERINADYRGSGLTVGNHPMALRRPQLDAMNVTSAEELKRVRDGQWVRIAGSVICRQRPGTAKGFVFLSLEDETGIANAIVTPDVFDRDKLKIVRSAYLVVDGILQNQQNVISVRAQIVEPLQFGDPEIRSKDFA